MKKPIFAQSRALSALIVLALVFAGTASLAGCSKKAEVTKESIAVFVPGVTSGSPIYEMLANGVRSAVADANKDRPQDAQIPVTVVEAGTNQAEWGNKLTALAADGSYTCIITSNPSIPDLAAPLTSQFPAVKFIILDAFLSGNTNIATVQYNQREQGYLAGYAAGLATTASKSQMQYANSAKKVALVAAQEYPVMNNVILPAFTEGAKAVDPEIEVLFRVVGNWYDASKSSELCRSLYKEGVDVVLPICGGASQGVIATAQELGFYITWFDDNGFAKAPGYVISSSVLKQEVMAYENTANYLAGETAFGTAATVGIAEGYVTLVEDDPLYLASVPEAIRARLHAEYQRIVNGELMLTPAN